MPNTQNPRSRPKQGKGSASGLLARRRQTLGVHSPLFYDEPIALVSGEGVWVTDVDGRTYLDAYNNVPHVGHCNPVVVEAICAQASQLNIHTRYLNSQVIDYAEELVATFGAGLDKVSFTNSGSEANDLAFRIANQRTGNTGIIVSDFSYHGNTSLLADVTTALPTRNGLSDNVRAIRIPDLDAAGNDLSSALLFEKGIRELDAAIESLNNEGFGVSAFLFDPLFSTEGLCRLPDGYLQALQQRIHAAGGLVISDEVQSGFGRTGEAMWGHELSGLTPDIVTMGKPMGNGHPIGGVVTRAELLDEFGAANLYFNTFAGNPVSAAAGRAVLQVMNDEDLMANAQSTGSGLKDGLEQLAARFDFVSAVKGRGLFFGIELLSDPKTGLSAPAVTKKLVENMKSNNILISKVGRHETVLKMRPPLVFNKSHAELLLEGLEASLNNI
ncbi:aspartate aminotransferase family protein [Arthrobacter sp. M4]|uniref:aspartate aminotransferase family protein n=1 Tax=Arthrobacter sp. M4 TaxID=218160 RepID=UPI001CDCDC97|nr:aminotransferase class III-fold pyridoxal phosphate-dependent enzyme [Arthrobacter sp. M4]MCA4132552.1 aminotransferase class III-fold pyridoxal phosphate-dependent enzyme [Arthrobacter sp. M4]